MLSGGEDCRFPLEPLHMYPAAGHRHLNTAATVADTERRAQDLDLAQSGIDDKTAQGFVGHVEIHVAVQQHYLALSVAELNAHVGFSGQQQFAAIGQGDRTRRLGVFSQQRLCERSGFAPQPAQPARCADYRQQPGALAQQAATAQVDRLRLHRAAQLWR